MLAAESPPPPPRPRRHSDPQVAFPRKRPIVDRRFRMAYGITHKFKGGTKEQYDASVAVVHPPEGLPDGQLHHFAGETSDGWIVVAIHDSKESCHGALRGRSRPGRGDPGHGRRGHRHRADRRAAAALQGRPLPRSRPPRRHRRARHPHARLGRAARDVPRSRAADRRLRHVLGHLPAHRQRPRRGPLANPAHYFILIGLYGVFIAGLIGAALPEKPTRTSIQIWPGWHAPIGVDHDRRLRRRSRCSAFPLEISGTGSSART